MRKNVERARSAAITVLLGTALLGGCAGPTGPGSSTTGTPSAAATTPATPATTPEAAGPGSADPGTSGSGAATATEAVSAVECGPVQLPGDGPEQALVALPSERGRVGCTEAFTVYDAFAALPADQLRRAALGDVELSDGWSCTLDDGATRAVYCVKERLAQGRFGFSFQTRPLD